MVPVALNSTFRPEKRFTMPIDPGPYRFSVRAGVRLFEAEDWAIAIDAPYDYHPCTYLELGGRILKFSLSTPAGPQVYGCAWRWEGAAAENDAISLEYRKIIIGRIVDVIERFVVPDRVNAERLMIEAGLATGKPRQTAPGAPQVTQIDESHLRFSYQGKTLTVPIDFEQAPLGAVAIQYKDLRHWDDPHQEVVLSVPESGFVMQHVAIFVKSTFGRSLIMFK
jgi:hypothetical protein